MFGKKKSNEIEELENRARKLESIAKRTCSDLLLDVDQISVHSFSEGEHIKELEEKIQQVKDDQEATKSVLGTVKEQVLTLAEGHEADVSALKRSAEALDQDQKTVTELIENGRHSTEVTTKLQESSETLMKRSLSMTETVEQMGELGRNMSVLALNSAIEAGRLGSDSVRFVAAAEQVRTYSENYSALASDVAEGLQEINDSFGNLTESIGRINDYLKKNSILLGKTLTRVTEDSTKAKNAVAQATDSDGEELEKYLGELMALREESSALLVQITEAYEDTRSRLQEGRDHCQTMEDHIKKLQGALDAEEEQIETV